MARILVVDDEAPMRRLLKEILMHDRHDVVEAANGEQARALFREQGTDLVITDLVMPEITGLDLILALRKEDPEVRIIAISGGGGAGGRVDALAIARLIGAGCILGKPFQVADLRAAVQQALGA